jgi:hypothetical protein
MPGMDEKREGGGANEEMAVEFGLHRGIGSWI